VSPEGRAAEKVAALALAGVAVVASCARAGPGGPAGTAQPLETLLAEPYSGLAEARREVLRDEAGWARVWAEIHAGVTPEPPLPQVDFTSHMLVAVALGTRPSGGYGVKVASVTVRGEQLLVSVVETCPARGARVITSLTQPVAVVRLPRLAQAPKFEDTRSAECR
jgi:hypothetical protein